MELLFVAIGTFGLVGVFIFMALAPRAVSREELVEARVRSIALSSDRPGRSVLLKDVDEDSFWERIATFFLGESRLLDEYGPMSQLLHQAGYPGERGIRVFWGTRVFLMIAFPALGFLFGVLSDAQVPNLALTVILAAGLGYMIPLLYVRQRARVRMLGIEEAFPDTLDLLVVCVEGGLGTDAALVRVGNEQAAQGLAVGDEFLLMTREIQAGIPRRDALTRMAERLDSEYLRSLAGFLIQTEELGGSIARSLRVYAATMREKRRQRAEEAARKMVIRLLFPLAFLIMPSMFLVIFAPPAIRIMEFLASPMGGVR